MRVPPPPSVVIFAGGWLVGVARWFPLAPWPPDGCKLFCFSAHAVMTHLKNKEMVPPVCVARFALDRDERMRAL